eukprot:TRINITY_DN5012_c0_g1_i2.p1 TRINITY_DN5012_c0_g1~~TRINITY_DN5012_c0_g1_i2.p1  ORF type:complete len:612 (-),score=201.33 TRINITY_DN5012_c0_g1_i2:341-2176(-)
MAATATAYPYPASGTYASGTYASDTSASGTPTAYLTSAPAEEEKSVVGEERPPQEDAKRTAAAEEEKSVGKSSVAAGYETLVNGKNHEERKAKAGKILAKNHNQVPIHVLQPKRADWPAVDKKFITPRVMTCQQFMELIRKELLKSGEAIPSLDGSLWSEVLLFAGPSCAVVQRQDLMGDVYDQHKAPDLMLYVTFETLSKRRQTPFPNSPYDSGIGPQIPLAEHEERVAALESLLLESDRKLKAEENANSELCERLEALKDEAASASETHRTAEAILESALSESEERRKQAEAGASEVKERLEAEAKKGEELELVVLTLKQAVQASQEGQEEAQEALAREAESVKDLQSRNQHLQEELQASLQTKESIQEQQEQMARREEAQENAAKAAEELAKQTLLSEDLEQKLDGMKAQLEAAEAAQKARSVDLAAASEFSKELQADVVDLSRKVQALQEGQAAAAEELAQERHLLAKERQALETERQTVRELTDKNSALAEQLQAEKTSSQSLQAELEATLVTTFEEQAKKAQEDAAKIQELEKKLADMEGVVTWEAEPDKDEETDKAKRTVSEEEEDDAFEMVHLPDSDETDIGRIGQPVLETPAAAGASWNPFG